MSAGARKRLYNANDSKSLWNFTLNPGWTKLDGNVLRLALIRYGCGNWKDISRHFPFKNLNQLNGQTQRAFGQQSLAELARLHIDPDVIRAYNETVRKDAYRKNNCIVHVGPHLTAAMKRSIHDVQELANSIPDYVATQIHIPVLNHYPRRCATVTDKISKLNELYRTLNCCQTVLAEYESTGKPARLGLVAQSCKQEGRSIELAKKQRQQRIQDLSRTATSASEYKPWIAFRQKHDAQFEPNSQHKIEVDQKEVELQEAVIAKEKAKEKAKAEQEPNNNGNAAKSKKPKPKTKAKPKAKAKAKAKAKSRSKPKMQIESEFQESDIKIVDVGAGNAITRPGAKSKKPVITKKSAACKGSKKRGTKRKNKNEDGAVPPSKRMRKSRNKK